MRLPWSRENEPGPIPEPPGEPAGEEPEQTIPAPPGTTGQPQIPDTNRQETEQPQTPEQLIEQARDDSYREAKRIYGTRLETMGRLITTLMGKGWWWNKINPEISKNADRRLKALGKLELRLTRAVEESEWGRKLKIVGKIGLGGIGLAATIGTGGFALAPIVFLISAPMTVDGVLEIIQFSKEREKVQAWKQRETTRQEMITALEAGDQANLDRASLISSTLDTDRSAVDQLAGSKRRWGWYRLIGRMAATGGAIGFMNTYGIATGMRDLDHVHQSAVEIMKGRGIPVNPNDVRDIHEHATVMLDQIHRGVVTGLNGHEVNTLQLASWMNTKHQTIQYLHNSHFVYQKGEELAHAYDVANTGSLHILKGGEHVLSQTPQSMIGFIQGLFGFFAADPLLTSLSAATAKPRRAAAAATPPATGPQAPTPTGAPTTPTAPPPPAAETTTAPRAEAPPPPLPNRTEEPEPKPEPEPEPEEEREDTSLQGISQKDWKDDKPGSERLMEANRVKIKRRLEQVQLEGDPEEIALRFTINYKGRESTVSFPKAIIALFGELRRISSEQPGFAKTIVYLYGKKKGDHITVTHLLVPRQAPKKENAGANIEDDLFCDAPRKNHGDDNDEYLGTFHAHPEGGDALTSFDLAQDFVRSGPRKGEPVGATEHKFFDIVQYSDTEMAIFSFDQERRKALAEKYRGHIETVTELSEEGGESYARGKVK